MCYRLILATLAALALILACDSGPDGPEPTGPLFLIRVTDSVGNPVEGISVGRINHSQYLTDRPVPGHALPSTEISFDLPPSSIVTVTIYDYFGDSIARPIDHQQLSGTQVIQVDPDLPGFYRYEIVADDDTTDHWLVIENPYDMEESVVGMTDANGIWSTDDTLLFPCLLGAPPPIPIRDQVGNVIDTTFNFYSDTVTVVLLQGTESLTFHTLLKTGGNQFQRTWTDPSR